MTNEIESGFRSIAQGNVHDVDDTRHQVAVDFPHEQLDAYRTDFGKRCFDDYLSKQLPVMLVEHDKHRLIGHAIGHENGQRSRRLIGQFSDFDAVPLAKQYYAHIRDGDIPGWSFHYRNARSIAHPTARGGRRFIQADMPEFGPTVFPAIPGTRVSGLRSTGSARDAALAALDSLEQEVRLQNGVAGRRPTQPWELERQFWDARARAERSLARARWHSRF